MQVGMKVGKKKLHKEGIVFDVENGVCPYFLENY